MSLDARYAQRAPRIQTGRTTASTREGSRRLRFGNTPGETSDALLDLSSRGMKIRTTGPQPELFARIELELRHPDVRGAVSVEGEVRWVDPEESGAARVGISFVGVRDTTAVALEQLIKLELGSRVHSGGDLLGFIAPREGSDPGDRLYVVHNAERDEVATIEITNESLIVRRGEGQDEQFESLARALRALLEVQGTLRIVPPIQGR